MATTITALPYKLQLEEGESVAIADEPGPLPDGMLQNQIILYAFGAILRYFQGRDDVFVDTNTFVYFDRSDRNAHRLAPDLYIALGVDAAAIVRRRGYLIWEVGKPPDVVLEIASETTADNDVTNKRDLYERIRIGEYWRFDPTGGNYYGESLVGERLVDGKYRRLETHSDPSGEVWAHSPTLGLDFYWKPDRPELDRLRVKDPLTGEFLRSYDEYADAFEIAESTLQATETQLAVTKTQLVAERTERQAERERIWAAEAENRRLREQLRRLRGSS